MPGLFANYLGLQWDAASAKAKRAWVVGGALIAVVGLAGLVIAFSPRSARSRINKEVETTVMLPRRRDLSAEQLASELTSLERRIANIEGATRSTELAVRENNTQVANRITELGAGKLAEDRIEQIVSAKLEEQRRKTDERDLAKPSVLGTHAAALSPMETPPLWTPLPPSQAPGVASPSSAGADLERRTSLRQGLRVISRTDGSRTDPGSLGSGANAATQAARPPSGSTTGTGPNTESGSKAVAPAGNEAAQFNVTKRDRMDDAKNSAVAQTWLPAGSMLSGVLINGMDAPTSTVAQKNPTPALVRIKHDAILPNRYSADVKECFVLVSGYGVISTERANLRTENVSCVRKDGGVIETKLDGYVISAEDGKVGLRGRLVSKQGAILARSMIAGFFSGLSRALQPQSIIGINTNPTGSVETQQAAASSVFESGAYSGASNALTSVAKFYLDMAKEMFPVIEIDAGREAIIVLVHGTSLRLQR